MAFLNKKIYLFLLLLTLPGYLHAEGNPITPTSVKTPGGETMPYEIINGVKVFHLEAGVVNKKVFDNDINRLEEYVPENDRYTGPVLPQPLKEQVASGFGYNASIPGPTIIVNEGDKIKIYFKNNLSQPTTVHWHGLIVPNDMDGAGGSDDPVVMPGKTTTYEFTIKNKPGTYAYHSGFNDTEQVISGLQGMFIVLPKNGDDIKYDFAIMLQGWPLLGSGSEQINTMSMRNTFFTFNGLAAPNFPVMKVPYGAKVRIRLANMSSDVAHPIHLHGYNFMVTGTEGGPIQKSAQWPAATISTAPGQTRDIEFIANNPGTWRFHCHILHHIINNPRFYSGKKGIVPTGGMFSYLVVGQPSE
jgi:manganese oxidase